GYAEYVTVHGSNALSIPAGLSMAEAAAIPETFFTVWHNVFERGRLLAGERFLVHGGTSGIGTTAIQLAKAFGAEVFTTAGSAAKCEAARKLGADHAIDYNTEDFVEAIKAATGKRGVDVILDMVGGDYIERNYTAAAEDGRIVQIAFLNGAIAEVDFRRLMLKRLTHTGSTLRARPTGVKAGIARALEEKVWPLVEAGKVRPVMDSTFPLAEAAAAHARIDDSGHIGKIVLTVTD
ncbi:MAG TPA: NAD(P)H-quinone oxidoreductase, partial [Kaistiaceae bacterium]|nr:NAD(P)H-quinone oxidoreductase [Kaistiaceae bacterium]